MNLGVIRLSDLKGDAQSGPVRQREAITKKYADLGVQPEDITWAEDLDVSAFHVPPLKRPMLRRSFNALTPGSRVVFYRLDRFVRRVFPDFSDMVSFGAEHKLTLYSATEELDLLKLDGMMVATLLAFVAQKESENTSTRVKNTQSYLRRVGRWRGALPPYGYRPVQIEGKPGWYLEEDPESAGHIRAAVERLLQGHALYAVSEWLTEQAVPVPLDRARAFQGKPRLCQCGHDEHDEPCDKIHKCLHRKTANGKHVKLHEYDECSQTCPTYKKREWTRAGLLAILHSPAICGYTVENGTEIVRDDEGMPIVFAPGIIDFEETFQRVQAILDERRYVKVRTQSESLLLNLLFCTCGAPLYRAAPTRVRNGVTKTYVYYRHLKRGCPGARTLDAASIEGLVEREMLKTLGHLEVLIEATSSERRNSVQVELREVASQIVALTQDMYLRGKPRENHNEMMASLQARHAELTTALATEADPETEWVTSGQTFSEKWDAMDVLERRLWLLDAGVRVVGRRGELPPVDFKSRRPRKRSLIAASEGDVYAIIYLGNLGEILRRARGR